MTGFSLDPPSVLYRDNWVVVIQKPGGLLSQPGRGPALQYSVISRMLQVEKDLHLVHRLDRDTSGVLLLARGLDSLRRFSALFAQREVVKLYEAQVMGSLLGRGKVENRLARLQRDPPRYGQHPLGKTAITLWRTRALASGFTRVWLRPITGRSHQLRVHLAGLGHPILGDPIYGLDSTGTMRLHACAVTMCHPFTGRRLRVRSEAPVPDWKDPSF